MPRYALLTFLILFSSVLTEDDIKCEKFNSALLKFLFTGEMTEEHSQIGKMILYSGTFLSDLGDYQGCQAYEHGEYFRVAIEQGDSPIFIGLCLYKECSANQIYLAKTQLATFLKKFSSEISLDSIFFTRPHRDDMRIKPESSYGQFIVLPLLFLFIALNLFAFIQVRYFNSTNSLIKMFDPLSNFKSLVKPFPYSNTSCLNGIRFLAMFGVVYGHSFYIISRYGLMRNPSELKSLLQSVVGAILGTCLYAVDIFFFLSGFLFRINLPKNKLIAGDASFSKKLFLPILIRYVRLLPIMLLTVFGTYYVLEFISIGAFQDYSRSICAFGVEKSWTLLLYINNLIPTSCQGQSWYLANDMQFFILSLVVILLVKNKTTQDAIFGFILVVSLFVSFWLSFVNEFGYNQVLYPEPQDARFFDDYYIKPWTRVQPYLVGLIFANLYVEYEKHNKQDILKENQEESLYQRFNKWVCSSKTVKYSYLFLGMVLFFLPFAITYWVFNAEYRLDYLITACLNAFVKFLNVGGLGIMIHLSFMGELEFFDRLTSCDIYSAFTKIGYSVYMFHLTVYVVFIMNINSSFYVTKIDFFFFTVAVFGLTSLIGLVATVIYDSPITKIVGSLTK